MAVQAVNHLLAKRWMSGVSRASAVPPAHPSFAERKPKPDTVPHQTPSVDRWGLTGQRPYPQPNPWPYCPQISPLKPATSGWWIPWPLLLRDQVGVDANGYPQYLYFTPLSLLSPDAVGNFSGQSARGSAICSILSANAAVRCFQGPRRR